MEEQQKTRGLTRTAALLALLVTAQAAATPLGSPLLTGTVVNLLLILSVMTCGLSAGLWVALVSPIAAKLLGIGPLWSLLPFIAAGNGALAALWHVLGRRGRGGRLAALFTAAAAKCLVLYLSIVRFAIPHLLRLPEPQAAVVGGMFSLPQLATALAGGALALLLLPRLKFFLASAGRRWYDSQK